MKRSNTKWESFELAMCRTAAMRVENGESIYSQITWLYGTHIKGRTREAIRKKISTFLPKRPTADNPTMLGKKFQKWVEEQQQLGKGYLTGKGIYDSGSDTD